MLNRHGTKCDQLLCCHLSASEGWAVGESAFVVQQDERGLHYMRCGQFQRFHLSVREGWAVGENAFSARRDEPGTDSRAEDDYDGDDHPSPGHT